MTPTPAPLPALYPLQPLALLSRSAGRLRHCGLALVLAATGLMAAAQTAPDGAAPKLRPAHQISAQGLTPPDATSEAASAEAVGSIKTVTGLAYVVTDGRPVRATVGQPVHLGSVLRTGADASLGVSFRDGTLMAFGPRTELTVDEYLYAPAQGQLRLGARLARGTLNYISGVIAKLRPDGVSITTPAGVIGVRGTQFVARVDAPDAGATP